MTADVNINQIIMGTKNQGQIIAQNSKVQFIFIQI